MGSSRSFRWLPLCALAGLACQSLGTDRSSFDERLSSRLEAWREERAACGRGSRDSLDDCRRAEREVERLTLDFPREPDALFAAAAVAHAAGRSTQAASYLDALRTLRPAHAEAAALRAHIALEEGNARLARRLLEQQVRLSPAHSALHETLAAVAFFEGDLEGARRTLAQAERLGAPAWRVAYHEGLVEEAAGDPIGAAAAYRRALAVRPEHREADERLRGIESALGAPR
jgi:tetratricopeptide (TPR) repeat protein